MRTGAYGPSPRGARGRPSAVVILVALSLGCTAPDAAVFPEPVRRFSQSGALETALYVQYAKAGVTGATDAQGHLIDTIWTRAYGTSAADPTDPLDELPGPTLVFHPGDWLRIDLNNQLNEDANPWLDSMETNLPPQNQDDIVAQIPRELNIPHNANNTNLHVHGMHVDPTADDVTLLIFPEDDDPSQYSPELQRLIPDINRWWTWSYRYRIPPDHLPGTHWYHAHKHGSTSTHVENGMAGTLIVRPNEDADAIVPGLWSDDPTRTHDRVLVLQEIANFGIQQGRALGLNPRRGRGGSITDTYTTNWPEITVNGVHQPTLEVAPGQVERLRFIDAGANHRSATYLWVGGLELPDTLPSMLRDTLGTIQDFATARRFITIGGCASLGSTLVVPITPFPGSVSLVAVDGITLHQARAVRPDRPILIGPGNRSDVFIQPDADAAGDYYVSKNFDVVPPLEVFRARYAPFFDGEAGYWRYTTLIAPCAGQPIRNVVQGDATLDGFRNLSLDPYALGTDFNGFTRPWPSKVRQDGSVDTLGMASTPMVPLLKAVAVGPSGLSTVPIAGSLASISGANYALRGLGWAPNPGGPPSLVDNQVLMTVRVSGPAVGSGPSMPTDARLNRLSPTTTDPDNTLLGTVVDGRLQRGIPAYVSPIPDSAVAGRQVIVFDRSGIQFNYVDPTSGNPTVINQFSLNGRQFDLNDFLGNPKATALISTPVGDTVRIPSRAEELGYFVYNGGGGDYSNEVRVGSEERAFVTNPGYYRVVVPTGSGYTYDYAGTRPGSHPTPTYSLVTGLSEPRQPVATTAEEWVLINNSRVFHPFHIHISPFFLTEVGQLDYDTATSAWSMKTLQRDDPLGYMLDNWWDVVIIPPQGYVKFRTWMNIPDQKPTDPDDPDSRFTVQDNQNVFGSWVYHCHILRHEDRGMMMVVNVRPKPETR